MSTADDFKKFQQNVEKALKEFTSNQNMKELGDFEAALVKRRSRLGFGVPKDLGPKAKFEKLSPVTVAARKRKKLAAETSPGKSNLTETGKLLNDLVSRVTGQEVTIGHTDKRNQRIGGYHQVGGVNSKGVVLPQRRYLGLAKEDVKQITANLQDKFNEILNRIFK